MFTIHTRARCLKGPKSELIFALSLILGTLAALGLPTTITESMSQTSENQSKTTLLDTVFDALLEGINLHRHPDGSIQDKLGCKTCP